MVMALGVVLWNLLRKHLLPRRVALTTPARCTYAALTLYFVMGLGIGALLGRLTRRKTAVDSPME
jgi:hypothetical protein